MEVVNGYFDYNISEECVSSKAFSFTAETLINYGYRTIAVNQVVDEKNLEPKKKKKKGESREPLDVVPRPIEIEKNENFKNLRLLKRLTIIFSNQDLIHKVMKSTNYKKYDIVAVLPTSQQALQYVCGSMDVDIICFDPESKPTYKLSRKIYNQLVDKGTHFEISYGPAIRDSTQRKNTIHISHLYYVFGKSRNIIVSSGATTPYLIRSPYDIINLGLIFGLKEEQAKNAILSNGRNVFVHSVGRRFGRSLMFIENISSKSDVEEIEAEEMSICKNEEEEEMDVDQPVQKKSKQ